MSGSNILSIAGGGTFLDFIVAQQKMSFLDYDGALYTNSEQREKHISVFSKMLSQFVSSPLPQSEPQPVVQKIEEKPIVHQQVTPKKTEIRAVNLDYLQYSIDKIRRISTASMEAKVTMVLNLLHLSSSVESNIVFARNLVTNSIPVDRRNMMLLNMVSIINQKARK